MKNIKKSFGQNVALAGVDFFLYKGEIQGLLGGNGAGKTTLMNVLYGLYQADSGSIYLNGNEIKVSSPLDALNQGIGMVHQHFLQIPGFSVIENIVLGSEIKNKMTMNLDSERQKIDDLCKKFNLEINLDEDISEVPMGERQKVEILKALYRGAQILILDEPTTNLTPQEVDDLFLSLREMVNDGLSIVFITHKLREVLSVCDRITVMKDGNIVESVSRDEADEQKFIQAMVGDDLDLEDSVIFNEELRETGHKIGDTVLIAEQLKLINDEGREVIKNINLELKTGEIFGLAGVAGNGQPELVEAILGIQKIKEGKVTLEGEDLKDKTMKDLLSTGVAYIPEDRLHDGILPGASVSHNLILGYQNLEPNSKNGMIDWNVVRNESEKMIDEFQIKCSGPDDVGANLSGGNIQRVMLARAFSRKSKFLIAHNPARGLDIPSTDFLYGKMLNACQEGSAVLLISENLDELLLLSDRIGVMYGGKIVKVLTRDKFEKYLIGELMSGMSTSEEEKNA